MTDEFTAYVHGIPKLQDKDGKPLYSHSTVNHSKNFVNPKDGTHTNTIEGLWNVAKSANRRRWGTHRAMLDSYLLEFMWRQRTKSENQFAKILAAIAFHNPPTA
jgi:hypothetical protein